MSTKKENIQYVLKKEVAIEDFEDGSLIFLSRQRRMIEINHTARQIIALMDGKRELNQVIKRFARDQKIREDEARKDINKLIMKLCADGVIKPEIEMLGNRRSGMAEPSRHLANPDVSLREENDGALLFNADTNALEIINPVGLLIWKFLRVCPRTKVEIVNYLNKMCDDVPADCIASDVEKFIAWLQAKGFVMDVQNEL